MNRLNIVLRRRILNLNLPPKCPELFKFESMIGGIANVQFTEPKPLTAKNDGHFNQAWTFHATFIVLLQNPLGRIKLIESYIMKRTGFKTKPIK